MKLFNIFNKKHKKEVTNTEYKIPDNFNEINALCIDIDNKLESKTNYGENLDTLNDKEKIIYVLNSFMKEVYNGGFEQFLFNSSGSNFGLLENSLKEVKADNILLIYKNIFKYFPKSLPKDENEKDDILFKIVNKKISKKISECDMKFYNIQESNLQELIYNYIIENIEYFK